MQTWNTDVESPSVKNAPVPFPLSTSPKHPSLPPPSNDFTASNTAYRGRLISSIIASFILNLAFLWLLFATDIAKLAWFKEMAKPKPVKEMPRLVLIERPPPSEKHQPKTFLETDASQAEKEPPKDPKFYSEHNTTPTQTTESPIKSDEIPKLDGHNTKTIATETVRLSRPSAPSPPIPAEAPKPAQPEQPRPPQPETPKVAQTEPPKQQQPEPPKPTPPPEKSTIPPPPQPTPKTPTELPKVGEYVLLKPVPREIKSAPMEEPTPPPPKPTPQTAPRPPPTPPTPQQQNTNPHPAVPPSPASPPPSSNREIVTSMSKLDGGVGKVGEAAAFGSAESPFATYDKKVIGKIGAYWQANVSNKYYGETVGEVEVTFKLLSDGKVSDLRVTRNNANRVLAGWCIQAIEDSAPFAPFPASMKAMVGDFREGTLTFSY